MHKIKSEKIQTEIDYIKMLHQALPQSDIDTYCGEIFQEFINHACMLRKEMPWCAALREEDFFQYVLSPRINNEDISSHRPLFYEKLRERVQNLSLRDAVLEVNKWCCENAGYESQDDRTMSALTVYKYGSGRCGEESVFLVSALRSVGIAARQIYAPWWSHCDDNHAWVEVLIDGKWYFLGACEPEPILNKGWFNMPSSRAMMIRYADYIHDSKDMSAFFESDKCKAFGNRTSFYGETVQAVFQVQNWGEVVRNAAVSISVVNEAGFREIASVKTDENGKAVLHLGKGTLWAECSTEKRYAGRFCNTAEKTEFILCLGESDLKEDWIEFDFYAPEDREIHPALLTDEQKIERAETILAGRKMRESKMNTFISEIEKETHVEEKELALCARGNTEELFEFLRADKNSLRVALLNTLSRKDFRDFKADILEEHLKEAGKCSGDFEREIFEKYLLAPRIEFEQITAWRKTLHNVFCEKKDAIYENPSFLRDLLTEKMDIIRDQNLTGLRWSPDIAWKAKRCDEKSLYILCVAVLRSIGIPARLDTYLGKPEMYINGGFIPVFDTKEKQEELVFEKKSEDEFIYRQNWSISFWENGRNKTVNLDNENWEDNRLKVRLPRRDYCIITSVRLPNGNQFLSMKRLVEEQKEEVIQLKLRKYKMKDMLSERALPNFSAGELNEKSRENRDFTFTEKSCHFLFWLEEGTEPTEHVLNELIAAEARIKNMDIEVYFFLKDENALCQPTLKKTLNLYEDAKVYIGNWAYNLEMTARHFTCDPEQTPLYIVCTKEGKAVYADCGYRVGAVDMCVNMAEYLSESL